MPVLINFKICDNDPCCSSLAACPCGAIVWDGRSLDVDDSKCTGCGACVGACPVGAVRVASSPEEVRAIRLEYARDPRRKSDLFIEHYGAAAISKITLRPAEELDAFVAGMERLALVELFDPAGVECLLNSIPVREILAAMPAKTTYVKVASDAEFAGRHGVSRLPALLVAHAGAVAGVVEGYFDVSQSAAFLEKIKALVPPDPEPEQSPDLDSPADSPPADK